jgi:hypothetical protein
VIEPNFDYSSDPLREITRKERRNLLISSAGGVWCVAAEMVPSKIVVFGVELSVLSQNMIIVPIIVIIVYSFFAFLFYGLSDFFLWRGKYQKYLEQVESFNNNWTQEDQLMYDDLHRSFSKASWLYKWSKFSVFAQLIYDFVVPLFVSFFAIVFIAMKFKYIY